MSIEKDVLRQILNPKYPGNKLLLKIIDDLTEKGMKRDSIHKAIYRLKNKKYITFTGSKIAVTANGERYIKKQKRELPVFDSPFPKTSPKNLRLVNVLFKFNIKC